MCLYENYRSTNKINELLNFGDLSSLKKYINYNETINKKEVCVAYHRDLNESMENTKSNYHNNINDFRNYCNDTWCEEAYLFDERRGIWLHSHIPFYSGLTSFDSLEDELYENKIINEKIKIQEVKMFEKKETLKVSEVFFRYLEDKLKDSNLDGYYEAFNNCREQGLILKIYDGNKELNIWACQCRNSDNIMVVIGNENNIDHTNNMFDEISYSKAKHFKYDDYDMAVKYAFQVIKHTFPEKINITRHFRFDTHEPIEKIRRIELDQKWLDYDDYYDLATFYDDEEKYLCDLVINDGKLGYQYSKIVDEETVNKICFVESSPDLTNEETLMMDMKKSLDQFIHNEIDINISENISI